MGRAWVKQTVLDLETDWETLVYSVPNQDIEIAEVKARTESVDSFLKRGNHIQKCMSAPKPATYDALPNWDELKTDL